MEEILIAESAGDKRSPETSANRFLQDTLARPHVRGRAARFASGSAHIGGMKGFTVTGGSVGSGSVGKILGD